MVKYSLKVASEFSISIRVKQKFCFSGVGIDGPNDDLGNIVLVKKKGKVQMLQNEIEAQEEYLNFTKVRNK